MFKFDKLGLPEDQDEFNMLQNPMANSADVMAPPAPTDTTDPRDALRAKLIADLTAKAKANIEKGRLLTSENELSRSDFENQATQQSFRAFGSALQKASNSFGSQGGKNVDTAAVDNVGAALNAGDASVLKGRQALYDEGKSLQDSGMQQDLAAQDLPSKWKLSDGQVKAQDNQFADRDTGLAKTARESDPTSQESANYRTWLKDTYGKDIPPGMSYSQLKEAQPFFAKKFEIEENNKAKREVAYQNSLNRQETRANTAAINGARQDDKHKGEKAKADEKEELITIPGFKRVPGMRVVPKSADELRKGVASYKSFQRDLATLKDMVKEYGTYETGPKGAVMQSLATQIQLKYKEIANLGVLSGKDMEMVEGVIPTLGNKVFARNDSAETTLETFMKSSEDDFNKTMPTFGYVPEGQEAKSGNQILDNMFGDDAGKGKGGSSQQLQLNGWSTRK